MVVAGLVTWVAGCRQTIYDARSLPPELGAPAVVDVEAIDLTRLARAESTSMVIQVGDVLGVTVVTGAIDERPASWPLRVADDGTINVPLVGGVRVASMDLLEAEQAIRRASINQGVYRAPAVSVAMETRRTNRITVLGAVEEPGAYELPVTGSDLVSAVVAAGGLSEEADHFVDIRLPSKDTSPNRITDRSGGRADHVDTVLASYAGAVGSGSRPDRMRIDLLSAGGTGATRSPYLDDGSVVMVTSRPEQFVHVMGLVNTPDQFEMPRNQPLRVLGAVALAGGLSTPLANKVFVIRKIPELPEPILIRLSIRSAKKDGRANITLAPGDIVSVEETPETFVFRVFRQFFRLGVGVTAF